jgi:uncharacterized protein (TIGR03435 family)
MMSTFAHAALAIGGSTAASVLAKITLTTTLALAGVRLARKRTAAVRHLLLAAAFAMLALLPIGSLVVPVVRVPVPVAARVPAAPDSSVAIATEEPWASTPRLLDASTGAWKWRSVSPVAVLLATWIAGAAICLSPLLAGLWQLRALRRRSLPWRTGQTVIDPIAAEIGVGRRVEVLLHESISGPMTCGLAHPAIVLPLDATTWWEEDLRRALVHELEHVRRADWLTQGLARLVCACYWFHPLVWIAWRQLVLEAERACDDAVLRRSESTAYADQLVALAQRLSAAATREPQLAMANRHDLATRVVAVLDSRQHRGPAGVRWITLACAASALAVATIAPLRLVAEQAPSDRSSATQKFDAASIRPCRTEEAPPGPARGGAGGTNATFSTGRMNVPCVTLEQLIYLAYAGSGATSEEQLVNVVPGGASDTTKVRGGPAWLHSQRDKFAVEATAPGASERYVLLGSMLRTLLEERFQLKVHRESEDVPMYTMTLAKGGLKMRPIKEGECDADRSRSPFDPGEKPMCGMMTMGGRGPNAVWNFVDFPMSSLANRLSGTLGRHVIDRTGVGDRFIIHLEFHPDENTPGIKWSAERDADASAPQAASIFTALGEQIGVKLEKTRGPQGFLVIDHVERPALNGDSGR